MSIILNPRKGYYGWLRQARDRRALEVARREHDAPTDARIIELREAGLLNREIAKELQLSESTLERAIGRLLMQGRVKERTHEQVAEKIGARNLAIWRWRNTDLIPGGGTECVTTDVPGDDDAADRSRRDRVPDLGLLPNAAEACSPGNA